MANRGDTFKSGQAVPESGIYSVVHDTNHAQNHEVTCVAGKTFPPCRGCSHPQFILKYAAQHIEKHASFRP
jgi:hypothetical protein